jgi:hypothetical protein
LGWGFLFYKNISQKLCITFMPYDFDEFLQK